MSNEVKRESNKCSGFDLYEKNGKFPQQDAKNRRLVEHLKTYKPKSAKAMANFMGFAVSEYGFKVLNSPFQPKEVEEISSKKHKSKRKG